MLPVEVSTDHQSSGGILKKHMVLTAKAALPAGHRYMFKAGATALATLVIAAGLAVPARAATSVSPNAINTYSRAEVAAAYANQWIPTTKSPINWTGDAASCQAGAESADSLAKGAQAINFYRGLAGLDSVSLTDAQNTMAQTTALIMEANGTLSHYPDARWSCYTALGAQGAATSNLHGGREPYYIGSASEPIESYMDDDGGSNAAVGHRRWVLNPSTVTMGMGTTKSFNALTVMGAPTDASRSSPTMIGFPGSGYFPQQLEPNGRWSISSDQGVDFSAAAVSVKDANGTALGVTPLSTAIGYGPNSMSFQVNGLSYASGTSEADYTVTVDNMKTYNLPFSYHYTVRLFDGTVSTSSVVPADPMPTLPTPPVSVVPQSPTFGDGSYTIPTTAGVVYRVNGLVTQAGTYNTATPITITAEAASSAYAVVGQKSWSTPITVTATAPTFNATTYTIPYQDGVLYQVNGIPVLSGTHAADGWIGILATAKSGYVLTGTSDWNKDYSQVGAQPTQVTPVAPTLGATSYTIPTVTGVDYMVDNVVKAAGTYNASTKVTITAVAQAGYVLSGTATWTKDFTVAPTPVVQSPIAIKAASLGGGLGAATGGEVSGLRDGGAYQLFERGAIYWSPAAGAHVNAGAIRGAFAGQGWENGFLGYPVTDEVSGLRNGGVFQSFQGGTIYWSPATGAHINAGAIRGAYTAQGGESGFLGYPVSNEAGGIKSGGAYQSFQGGQIHWSPATGAFVTAGAIGSAWAGQGWENGRLGYPVSNEAGGLKGGGAYQSFQGAQIHWSPATGAHSTAGAIGSAWAGQGWENGRLGYPLTEEYSTGNGSITQNYQGGTITWSPAMGTRIL
jgi:hypothetical protein